MRRRWFWFRVRRSRVLWCTATVTLTCLTWLVVSGLVSRAQAAAREWGATRPALVLTRPVAAGAVLEAGDVVRRAVPAGLLPRAPLAKAVTGRVARVDLVAGEVVVLSRLAPDGVRGVAALLPDGTRALAVPAGPAGLPPVAPGDHVDILATVAARSDTGSGTGTGSAEPGASEPTVTVASGALVVAIDRDAGTVTVAVAADIAPELAYAVSTATITVALSSPTG